MSMLQNIATSDQLMEQLAAPENLLNAWRSVRGNIPRYRRQRSAGPDGITLADFERDLPAQLSALRHMLLKDRYQPQAPGIFTIQKKNGGIRYLAVLNVADRVAQRAAQQVIEPLYEPLFLPCSFGFRPGRSTLDAIVCVRRLRSSGYRWVVDGDIASCFDSLDHRLLIRRMEKRISDRRVLELLQRWLDTGVLEQGMLDNGASTDKVGFLPGEWEKVAGRLKQGVHWALSSFTQSQDLLYYESRYEPHAYKPMGEAAEEHSISPDLDEENISRWTEDEDLDRRALQQKAMQQVAAGGLLLGTSWVKRYLFKAGGAAVTALKTPAGREILKKGLLAGGGAVGAAAGVAISAFLLYRNVAPPQAGVLQGSPLSPLLANIYLHPFDLSITRAGFRMARFADDWVILCPDQSTAEKAYNGAITALAQIHLKVNSEKTRILTPSDHLEWLGDSID